jgi:hypothetical protein
VKGLVNGVLLYDAGLNLDTELSLVPPEGLDTASEEPPPDLVEDPAGEAVAEAWAETDSADELATPMVATASMDGEAMVQLFASVPQDLAELRRLAASNQW